MRSDACTASLYFGLLLTPILHAWLRIHPAASSNNTKLSVGAETLPAGLRHWGRGRSHFVRAGRRLSRLCACRWRASTLAPVALRWPLLRFVLCSRFHVVFLKGKPLFLFLFLFLVLVLFFFATPVCNLFMIATSSCAASSCSCSCSCNSTGSA